MTDTDVELNAISKGDTDAFARWMAQAEPRLRRSLRSFAAQVDAEAVVQEALLRAWHFAPRLTADEQADALLRFSMRTARNLAITETRKRRPAFVPDDAGFSAEACFSGPNDAAELREAIADCFDAVPAKPRQAMQARLRGHYASDAALADDIGMTLNTFFQNIRRARLALLACLRRRGFVLEPEQ